MARVAVVPAGDGGTATTACEAPTTRQLEPGQCEPVSCVWRDAPRRNTARVVVVPDPTHTVLQCLSGNDPGEVTNIECGSPG